jgi:hypothetical protein
LKATYMVALAICFLTTACIPGTDNDTKVVGNRESRPSKLLEESSDWFLHNKVEHLEYDPRPPLNEDGTLPRSLAGFSLGGEPPPEGKPYRDNQKIFFIEERGKTRRLRIFSRDNVIFRLQTLTSLQVLSDKTPEGIMADVEAQYGRPQQALPRVLTYLDRNTVLQFKIGGDFFITDIMDIETTDLPTGILELIDDNYDTLK